MMTRTPRLHGALLGGVRIFPHWVSGVRADKVCWIVKQQLIGQHSDKMSLHCRQVAGKVKRYLFIRHVSPAKQEPPFVCSSLNQF